MSEFRVGVAGTGFGAAVLVPAFRSIPNVAVAAIASTDQSRAEATATKLGIPRAAGSVEQLLNLELDAVVLALPPDTNESAAEQAIARGLPTFSEKPLAQSWPAADRLARLAADTTTAVDFEFAELHSFVGAAEVVASGAIGAPRQVHVSWLTRSRAHEEGRWSWKLEAGRGGGVMAMLAPHVVHFVELLFGPATRVFAVTDRRVNSKFAPPGVTAAADSAEILLTTTTGVSATISLSNSTICTPVHEWRILGEKGTIVVSNETAEPATGFTCRVTTSNGTKMEAADPSVEGDGRIPAVGRLAARFVDAVARGAEFHPGFTEAASVQRVLDAVDWSGENLQAVDLAGA